jgi:homoserine O-acetyltransferase
VKHGRFVLIPISERTRGHGTHTWAAVWHDDFAEFLGSLPAPPKTNSATGSPSR